MAKNAVEALKKANKTLVTAESCTGGLLGKMLTDVAGASQVYLGGVISYAYELKEKLLGVEHDLLSEKGAVCEEATKQMALGAREKLQADLALSVTGNAGPGTDAKNPNVGEIFVALASENTCICRKLNLQGNREENRIAACHAALQLLLDTIA